MTAGESTAPPLFVQRSGTGPPVILVHGGLPARVTWARQQVLAARWSLIIPSRRGYAPNPAVPQQDFLADADDLTELIVELPGGAHLVGFSYGGLGAAVAAGRRPHLVRSLTLIEVPLFVTAEEDQSVRELAALADRFAADADDAQAEREFHAMAGVGQKLPAGEEDDIRQAMRLWRDLRSPREAKPRFEAIVEAHIPTLVVSGQHNTGLERLCDAVATELGAQRAHIPGAGHAVARAPGFNTVLETFLTAAQRGRDNEEGTL
ncbi:alpha/beta fold hydrolase [Nocardia colli]|uniref:alpha/beta fold hydrolase n=1 Tax=Nocardia colli TaxID=2545717 RepID=UPI00168D9003|nr:alpha/beta hydrolase [Nocardia colli]